MIYYTRKEDIFESNKMLITIRKDLEYTIVASELMGYRIIRTGRNLAWLNSEGIVEFRVSYRAMAAKFVVTDWIGHVIGELSTIAELEKKIIDLL